MLEETKLIDAKKELVEYATLVEGMIEHSIKGLKEKDVQVLTKVIEKDEPRANELEIDMNERCISLIARHQPAGKALRTILMLLNISNTLERMGDHAVTICESALFLIEKPPVKPLIDIPRMAQIVIEMLKNTISAFVNEDAELTQRVCQMDNTVDALRDQILRELITFMASDPTTIERSLQLMKISSNLERIADLSTNICEDIVYIVKGKIIKHHFEEI
ncbi:MAG: phosphate signaling complex protein PhoU [Deltaproteobacteria bacterium]|nr:phosphate signaling complex protein PhoU [Deltaproteobacteria bacterium]